MDNFNDFSGRGPFNPSNKNLLTAVAIHDKSFFSYMSRDLKENVTG